MKIRAAKISALLKTSLGFSLEEVIFSSGIASVAIAGLISGHNLAYQRALWSASSMSAQSLAMQRLEQARGAKWDQLASPAVDQLVSSNFPVQVLALPIPVSGTNQLVIATNTTTITTVSSDPSLKMVRVDCTWSFVGRTTFTNTVFTYRSPNQ